MNRFIHNNTVTNSAESATERLQDFLLEHGPVLVLTGAGISTDSGIPDYRDGDGAWKRKQPVQHQAFMTDPAARQRYWARSMAGWPAMQRATPNQAHLKLAALETVGTVSQIVTQNVDRLHQKAGSHNTVDLHGRADRVICMSCNFSSTRNDQHQRCRDLNPHFTHHSAAPAPDGDADLEIDFSAFRVPDCPHCGGVLKPDVVFFGDNVPRPKVQSVSDLVAESRSLLVVGSSLMVFSGFRFCRMAHEWGKPIALLNRGRTRADHLATLKIEADISSTLRSVLTS
jgi:NAD-dependent SIR2 family protein deacetylase